MAEQKLKKTVRYIDNNVYDEAKERIKHVINTFDKIYVCFSGGKDSLTVLKLTEEIYDELGIKDKINIIFRDEELIPDDVVDFVLETAKNPRYNFYYYAVPTKSQKFILGSTIEYIQWDENREWIRPKPDIAIEGPPGRVFDQYNMDAYCVQGVKGRIAFITGIRADESITRFNSCVNKANENYINSSPAAKNVKLVKPIYDWSEKDVFKYFYDKNLDYCPVYDKQVWNRELLRVATPVHAENAKKFDKLRTLAPKLYEQVINLMPDMLLQEKYWSEYDRYAVIFRYPHTWDGIGQYVRDYLEKDQRKLAVKRIKEAKYIRHNRLSKGLGSHNFGGYPLLYVFKCIANGQYKRALQPTNKASKKDFEYEGIPYPGDK